MERLDLRLKENQANGKRIIKYGTRGVVTRNTDGDYILLSSAVIIIDTIIKALNMHLDFIKFLLCIGQIKGD